MDVFNLNAKLSLDTDDYERQLNDASGKTTSFWDAQMPLSNPEITNVNTLETLKVNESLQAGEYITVSREGKSKRLTVTKTSGDVVTNIFPKLDDASTLYYIHAGDNVLRHSYTDGAEHALNTSVFYNDAYVGVCDDM